jgi:hypothetical protein
MSKSNYYKLNSYNQVVHIYHQLNTHRTRKKGIFAKIIHLDATTPASPCGRQQCQSQVCDNGWSSNAT